MIKNHTFFKFSIFWVFIFFAQFLGAQVFEGESANNKLKGANQVRISEQTGLIQFAELNENISLNEANVLPYFQKVYALNNTYSFTVIRKETDELGLLHIRYQINFNKVPVLGSILIAHLKNGRLYAFNGEVFKISELQNQVKLTESECLKIALDSTHAESYLWQIPEEEAVIKDIKEDVHATWYPKGELVYVPDNLNFFNQSFYLTYKFNVHASQPRTAENMYIDVLTGKLIARENQLHTTDVNGKAITKYSGTKNIITDSTAPFNYRLRENTRGGGVYTLNLKKGTNYGLAVDFLDSNNNWNNVNSNKDEVATDCHWGAETTYDYFKNKFNRNSYNNNNARINSYVHYAVNYDNAFWDGLRMTYGDGSSFKPLTSLDVCGHEITHAVTSNSANLIYSYQSGQLNESFSDIFGNAVERYGKPTGYSWIIGEEITFSGTGLRNMADPRVKGHPRCYLGTYWYSGAGDNGGVHLNSGVQNWWFYLITEGKTGTNDFSNAYKVDSLGILSAEKIAYRNLTVYLTPSSQYADSRFYSIQAAKDLFGPCSKEVIAVTNAWYACNVGPKYDSGYVKAAFSADTVICNTSKTVKFNNLSSNAITYKWSFGDGNTSTAVNPTKTYSNYGNYTIKLVATSCFKNKKDSLTKSAYVKVDSSFDICNAILMPASGTDSTHKCKSFIYDDGGEDIYSQSRITYYRISAPGADSIRIRFLDFDYEFGYDSLYVYKGKYPGTGTKVGGYTGSSLPFSGNNFLVAGNTVTLRHVSDPYVVGRGFKLFYTAIKKAVKVTAFSDTTICMGKSAVLRAIGSGGFAGDYFFKWNNVVYNDTNIVAPVNNTSYKIYLTDLCTNSKDSATVNVTVRNPLDVKANKDTTICLGRSVILNATATGGNSANYVYTWDNSLGTGKTKTVSPIVNTTYRVIISDACTPILDTAYVTVKVKNALKVKVSSNDTLICYNKVSAISANGSGGDSSQYSYVWANGLGIGSAITPNLTSSQWVKCTLADACSVNPASDSIYIVVQAPLSVQLNNDTTLCYGRGTKLIAVSSGGVSNDYTYNWSPVLSDSAIQNVKPTIKTKYKVVLTDNCSNSATDSITVDVLAPIVVSGLKDSTICTGITVPLVPIVSGGVSSTYTFTWNLGLGSAPSQLVSPSGSNTYQVIVRDGCTVLGDTALATITVKIALKPKIFSADTLVCFQNTSAFTVTATGGDINNYVFNWNNGLGTGVSTSGIMSSSKWVKVTLTDACTVNPGVDSIYVNVRPELKVSLPKDTLICYGSSIPLSANPIGGDVITYAFTWNQGLNSVQSNTISPKVKTQYIVLLNDLCSAQASDTMNVDVMAKIKISGLRDTTICDGASVPLNPIVSGGISANYNFTWNLGQGITKNILVKPLSNTVYKLVVDDLCTQPYDSSFVNITVRPALKLNVNLSDNSICQSDSSILKINMSGGLSSQYQWTINAAPNTSNSIVEKPSISTQYIVNLIDNCSQSISDTANLIVNPKPIVDFTVSKQTICRKESVTFNNLSSGAVAYWWHLTPTDSSNAPNPNYTYLVSGSYDVRLFAISDSLCVNEIVKTAYMNVVDLPISKFTYLPIQPDYLNRQVNFNNQSTNQSSFEWSFGDFSKETVNPNPSHTYSDTGFFSVRLIVRNSLGCADTMSEMLRVKDIFRIYIPDAMTVNDDLLNDEFVVLGRGIQFYNLQIFDRWGGKVYDGNMGDKPFDGLDSKGTPLMKGTYLINLTVRDFAGYMHYIRRVLEVL
jgi:Zn-dependent metalloprotease